MAKRSRPHVSDPPMSRTLDAFLSPSIVPELRALDQARAIVRAIEDRRTWHPQRALRPAGAVPRAARRLVHSVSTARGFFPPSRFSFAVPKKVAICVRRKTRREVLFAKRSTGKGAKSPRRRNRWSNIGC